MSLLPMFSIVFFTTALMFGASGVSALVPSDIGVHKLCSKTDHECFERVLMEDIIPQFATGNKEIGIEKMDPICFPKMTTQSGSGPVSLNCTLINICIAGNTGTKIKSAKMDANNRFDIEMSYPLIQMYGDYVMNGKVLVMPLQGNGEFKCDLPDVTGTSILKCSKEVRNGVEYLKVDSSEIIFDAPNGVLKLTGQMGNTINDFMNENFGLLSKEVFMPMISEAFGIVVKDAASKVFNNIPYNKLFKD